ncbi:hypothetical protein KSP40_PGU022266 [Platanthera guangdongensis]|uniref:Saposin B-type domain-containing protein n=1 Tax=Platanthera guangdongensis TaxID=2320717 RepID=A0ABR2MQ21_9ASPA
MITSHPRDGAIPCLASVPLAKGETILEIACCDVGIESVVKTIEGTSSHGSNDVMCTACEMAVVWMQNRLKQNQTQEQVLNHINQLCGRLPSPVGDSSVNCGAISSMPIISFTLEARHLTSQLSSPMLSLSLEPNCRSHDVCGKPLHHCSPIIAAVVFVETASNTHSFASVTLASAKTLAKAQLHHGPQLHSLG